MAEICGNCNNLDWSNQGTTSRKTYYCNELHEYRSPSDRRCNGYYSPNGGGSNSSNSWKPSGFSWITLIVNKFGQIFCNECEVTTGLLNFGKTFLVTNPEYNTVLENAQVNQIATTENEELGFFASLTKNFVLPWLEALKVQDNDSAMLVFKNMIDTIMTHMGIEMPKTLKTTGPNRILAN